MDGTTVVHEGMIKPTPTCGVPPPRPASNGIAQHPAARAAEGPPSRVSSRTADTASQPMDQALGHNIIVEVNGCENKEMHAVAAQNPPSHATPADPSLAPNEAYHNSKVRDWETLPYKSWRRCRQFKLETLFYKSWGLCSGSRLETLPYKSERTERTPSL